MQEGKTLQLCAPKGMVISPGMKLQMEGFGMPFSTDDNLTGFGNLIVEFNVLFPSAIEIECKCQLKDYFSKLLSYFNNVSM